jgi:hypothetical protein
MKRLSRGGRRVGRDGAGLLLPRGLALFVGVLCTPVVALAGDYSVKGPLTVKSAALPQSLTSPAGQIVYPVTGSGSNPWVVVGHAQGATSADQLGLAKHLASYGIIAVVPDLCSVLVPSCVPDKAQVSLAITALKKWISTSASPVFGKVAAGALGLVGHGTGAGVLASAAKSAGAVTIVLIDPVAENAPAASSAMASLVTPVLSLFGGKSTCNKSGAWEAFGVGTDADALAATVVGSNHCDGDPEWTLCAGLCGAGPNTTRSARFRHYTTAWLLGQLKSDSVARCEAAAPIMLKDASLSNVRTNAPTTCTAGTGGSAGSAGSGGTGGNSGQSAATPAEGGTTATPDPDDGRNEYFELGQLRQEGLGEAESAPACTMSTAETRAAAWLVPLGLALALHARRRSKR